MRRFLLEAADRGTRKLPPELSRTPGVTRAAPGAYPALRFAYGRGEREWLMTGKTWEQDGLDEGTCVDIHFKNPCAAARSQSIVTVTTV